MEKDTKRTEWTVAVCDGYVTWRYAINGRQNTSIENVIRAAAEELKGEVTSRELIDVQESGGLARDILGRDRLEEALRDRDRYKVRVEELEKKLLAVIYLANIDGKPVPLVVGGQ